MSRRTRQRRTRPRRDKGQGVSPPARSLAQGKPYEWKESDIEALREFHAQRSYGAQKTDEALIAPIAPSPTHWLRRPGEYDVYGVDYPEWRVKKQMGTRSEAAQRTDRALEAPLAPTPEVWAKHPDRYDLPGVDTKTKAKPSRVNEQKNPMGAPGEAKAYLADVVKAYRKSLGVKSDVKLRAQKRGYPARIVHRPGKASEIEVNYRHFGIMWERDSGLTRRYLEYMVAHELAHQRQVEELGYTGAKRANKVAKAEVEVDADHRAYKAMGTTEKTFNKVMDKLARRTGAVHTTNHPGFKGTPNLSRFKDHTPPEKPQKAEPKAATPPPAAKWYGVPLEELKRVPGIGDKTIEALKKAGYRDVGQVWSDSCSGWKSLEAVDGIGEDTAKNLFKRIGEHVPPRKAEEPKRAEKPEPRPGEPTAKPTVRETRDRMKVTYGKFLGEALPMATQAEREIIAEKAIAEEWVKPTDTDAKATMARIAEKARAELVKMRQEKAAQNREEQLKRLKELRDKATARKTDEDRLREKLALHREEYGVQYELNLDGALSLQAAGKRAELYKALLKKDYSKEAAAQISSTFNEAAVKRIQGEALKKARRETMDLADDAYGELPELWEEGVKKSMAAEAATRHAGAIMEAAYKEVLGSIRDRTEPPKVLTPAQPAPKAQSESPGQEKPSLYKELESRKFWAYSGEDGDLYRANGLGGWRVQVYWGTDLAIQKKVKDWAGTRWITAADFDGVLTAEDHDRVMGFVDRWMKKPSILDEQVKAYSPLTLEGLKKESPPAPESKPTVKTRSESYDFYEDPGHGWLRVPLKRLEELGIANDISPYSYVKGQYVYLEEDSDATLFTKTLESLGLKVGLREHTSNRESSIRRYEPYRSPAFKKARRIILEAKSHVELEGIEKAVYKDPGLNEEDKKQLAEYIRARSGNIPEVKEAAKYDEATERIVGLIIETRPDVPRAEVEKRITDKITGAAGLITTEAAATIVAADLGAEKAGKLSPTGDVFEEARRRYDATIADRVPRMADTWRLNLRKALTDQGFSPDEAKKISDRLTTEAAQKSHAEFFDENRVYHGVIAEQIIQRPEVQAERDALTAVQNEYEKLKKEALEEWAIARRKVTAISQSPEIKRIVEGYESEQPQDDLLPTQKKPGQAAKPVYNKETGMYEVGVYDPQSVRITKKQFSTPDKAEQYQKLINENPGWPQKSFKENIGAEKEPKYHITAENTLSRGSEALSYAVYERLPANAKRHDTYVDGRPYKLIANGSIEYKEVPGKQKIVEDLTKEYKGTTRVEFTPNPHWTPALSMVERVAPASPSGDRDGKWMVWFKNREGRDSDPREGVGTRSFDTYGEALDFTREERGRYGQHGVDREAVWTPIPEPPTLPEELRGFTGKQDRFEVDPHPQYEGTWNQEKKSMEYRWVFKNTTGPKGTHTLDELKEEHQKGEWRRRDRAEAAKSSKTLTKAKGAKNKDWDRKTQPLSSAMIFWNNAIIEAEGDKVEIGGMDQNHVAMMIMKLPNDMGIPDGKYEVTDSDLDSRVTHLRHPQKVKWDNVERSLSVSNENQESYIRYEKVEEYKDRYPEPKVRHQTEIRLDMEALKKAVDAPGIEHIALKVKRGIGPYGDTFTYEAEKEEKQTVTHGEGDDAWTSEENVKVPVTGSVGEVTHVAEDEVKTTYTTSYLSDNLASLIKAGFQDATLEFATDMPLKITAKRDDGAEAEFWLAPCIGV